MASPAEGGKNGRVCSGRHARGIRYHSSGDINMQTDPSARALYVWGRWVWYYRFLALLVYATGLLLVGLYAPARDLARHPSIENIALLALIALLVGVWFLCAWITWRRGQSQVARIILFPESAAVVVQTLNFGSRRIPLTALSDFQYEETQTYHGEYGSTQVYEPTLTVQARGGLPLKIDMRGHILDEQTFKTIFRHCPNKTPATRPRRRKKRARLKVGR